MRKRYRAEEIVIKLREIELYENNAWILFISEVKQVMYVRNGSFSVNCSGLPRHCSVAAGLIVASLSFQSSQGCSEELPQDVITFC